MKKLLPILTVFIFFKSSLYAQNATQVNLTGSSSTNTITNNTASAVDPGLTLTANGDISGFIVSITESYTTGDVLSYTGSLPGGISAAAFNTTTRSLVFTGTTSAANWQDLLRRVTLQTTSATCFPERREVTFTVGNKYYNPLTGHFYEYNSTVQNWINARNDAATRSYFGREGYLATITSAAENNFIWKIMATDAWVGATYDHTLLTGAGITAYANQTAAIGNVYWITGPERGTFISAGLTTPVAQNNQYMNWNGSEPNNYSGTSEFYVQLYSSNNGRWNDLPISSTLTSVVEYGGMPNDLSTSTVVTTRKIYVNGAPSGTITGGAVSVCSGTNSTTLSISGLTGSVVRWESSLDNFLTAGAPISNTSASYTVSDISQTTYYRAIVNTTSPSTCSNLTTSAVPVYVTATIAGNAFANNTTICPGSQAQLTLFGNSGNILKWQVADNSNFTSATDISNTTNNISHTLSTTGTYYFRAQVQNNGCGSAVFTPGSPVTVTSGTPPVGGSVSSNDHCSGSNSGALTLSGYTGSVQKWQYSADGGIIWTDVSNTTASLNYTGVSSTRLYRAVISNGSCGTTYSAAGTVLVYGNTQYQWLGTTNTISSTAANWKCSTLPPAGADVVISNTASNDLVLDQNYTLGNVDFSGSNRKIVLGNYSLTVNSLAGANSNNYVKTTGTGRLKMPVAHNAASTFPVGNSTYNPLTITNRTGTTDEFSVQVLDEVYQNGVSGAITPAPHVRRTWDISKTNANSGSGIDFVFNWNSGETTPNLNNPRLFHYEGGWIKQNGSFSSASNSFTFTGYTGTFSPFAIGDNGFTLPVNWLSFTAQKNNKQALLHWNLANEQNTRDFIVQHSTDGNNWTDIGSLGAAGSSNTQTNYSFIHTLPAKGVNSYRILQRDNDGGRSYSHIASLVFTETMPGFVVYPNPVRDGSLKILLQQPSGISLFSIDGKMIWQKQFATGLQQVDVSGLAKGIYNLRVNETMQSIIVE